MERHCIAGGVEAVLVGPVRGELLTYVREKVLLVGAVLSMSIRDRSSIERRLPGWSYLPMVRQAAQSLAFASALVRSISTAIYMVHAGI